MGMDEKLLREYVRREIAGLNAELSRMVYKFKESTGRMRSEIYRNFARGDMSYFSKTTGNLNLSEINDDIKDSGKKLSAYNYFDLDTLIAYKKYLEYIIENLYTKRQNAGRGYFLLSDFEDVINKKASTFFNKNYGTEDTGYYSLNKTIVALRDGKGKLAPESTMAKKSFTSKYSQVDFPSMLEEYLDAKHPHRKVSYDDGYDTFKFNGKVYIIEKCELYMSEDGNPIKYIIASTGHGTNLRGFFDMTGNVYHGAVYSTDGEEYFDNEQSGVLITGKGATTKYDGMGRR